MDTEEQTENVTEATTTDTGADTGYDVFEAAELVVPTTPPDAHQATIEGVTLRHLNNDKRTALISIALKSSNVPTLEQTMDVWVPKGFEESDPFNPKTFDPKTLPEEEGNRQQFSYRLGIANADKTATLQTLQAIAIKAGRSPRELKLVEPTSLDEYTENYNKLLTGLEVIFLRRAKGGEDIAFKNQLVVKEIVAPDMYETSPKKFKKYVRQWEENLG